MSRAAAPARGLAQGIDRYVGIAVVAVAAVLLAIVPPLVGGYVLRALTSYLIFGLLALSVALISGYGRLLNLGVGVNFGVAAYTVAIATNHGVTNPWVLLVAALVVTTLASLLFGVYALAASGVEYLMLTFLTTLAFATIPLATLDLTGGDNGLSVKGGVEISFGLNPLAGHGFYWLTLAVVLLAVLASWYLISSQTGRALQAIGRNPTRAAAMGYSVGQYRVMLTLFAGLVAGLGGWLYSLQTSYVFTDLLGLGNSANGLVYALIGGINSILGPFIGTVLLRYFTDLVSSGGGTQSSLYIGVVLMIVVYLLPDGLLGLWHQLRAAGRRGGRGAVAEVGVEGDLDETAGPLGAETPSAL